MSLLDRVTPAARTESDGRSVGRGAPPYALAFGYGVLAPVAFALLLFAPVLASWTFDPRTSTQWADALAITASGVGLTLRGSISVPHNEIEGLHFAPMLLTSLLLLLTRFAYRPVPSALDDADAAGEEQQRTPLAFLAGFVISCLGVTAVSLSGSAPVKWWSVLPGAILIALAAVIWSIRRDGTGVELPWAANLAERLHLNVRRSLRPAIEGVGVLLTAGAMVTFVLVMTRLDRVGKVAALLDVHGSGIALLWFAQVLALPNLILFATGWLTGAPVVLGMGELSTSSATATVLPSIPVLGALPEPGALPGVFRLALLIPVLAGAFIGWRATWSMPVLTHLGRKLQVASSAAGLGALVVSILLWWSRAGMNPGRLDLIGPAMTSALWVAGELLVGAVIAAAAVHYRRRLR